MSFQSQVSTDLSREGARKLRQVRGSKFTYFLHLMGSIRLIISEY